MMFDSRIRWCLNKMFHRIYIWRRFEVNWFGSLIWRNDRRTRHQCSMRSSIMWSSSSSKSRFLYSLSFSHTHTCKNENLMIPMVDIIVSRDGEYVFVLSDIWVNGCRIFTYKTLKYGLKWFVVGQVLSMSRLGGEAAVAPLVAEVKLHSMMLSYHHSLFKPI